MNFTNRNIGQEKIDVVFLLLFFWITATVVQTTGTAIFFGL